LIAVIDSTSAHETVASENLRRDFSIPWYISVIVIAVCLVALITPESLGVFLPSGKRGAVLVAIAGVVAIYALTPIWKSGDLAKITSMFLVILPVISSVSFRIFLGEKPYTYGPDFFVVLIFVIIVFTRSGAPLPSAPGYSALVLYCCFGILSVVGARFSVFSALDQYVLVIVLPVMFFVTSGRTLQQSTDAWWVVFGLVGFGVIVIIISFMRFSQISHVLGFETQQVFALDLEALNRFSLVHALLGGGLWGTNSLIGRATVIALPLALTIILRSETTWSMRLAAGAAIGLMGYFDLLSYLRSVIFSAVIGMVIVLLMARGRKKWPLLIFLVLISLIFLSWIGAYLSQRPVFTLGENGLTWANRGRWDHVYSIAWEMFLDRPISGVGMGRENYQVASHHYSGNLRHAHNMFLQLLSDRGIFAGISFLAFYFGVLLRFVQNYRLAKTDDQRLLWAGLLASMIGVTMYFQFELFWVTNRAFIFDIQLWALLMTSYLPSQAAVGKDVIHARVG